MCNTTCLLVVQNIHFSTIDPNSVTVMNVSYDCRCQESLVVEGAHLAVTPVYTNWITVSLERNSFVMRIFLNPCETKDIGARTACVRAHLHFFRELRTLLCNIHG